VVVIIDSPEFTHPIARGSRRRRPGIPIVDYVSPTVWAWRPGRARKMRSYVDHVLALWPFEPDAHERLGGPPCTYVGHPLMERLPAIRALETQSLAQRLKLRPGMPLLVVLPGSRSSEVSRLMAPFGDALTLLANRGRRFEVVIPVVESVRALIEKQLPSWPVQPHFVEGEDDKFRAFKLARAAMAASGTVTLELALAGTPMVVAYKVDALAAPVLRRLIVAPSSVLPNLILRENVVPEFHQQDCTPMNLANALAPLLEETPRRARQAAALAKVAEALQVPGRSPSEAAADIVLDYADHGRAWPRPVLQANA
jgi:lipid-A-disaccharide synthase